MNTTVLKHVVLDQIETDIKIEDWESIDELLKTLLEDETNKTAFVNYLSDSRRESLEKGDYNEYFKFNDHVDGVLIEKY